eukprot:m.22347 g.22347  ORF g.22347 m.22347 type:complete len:276 (-) comp3739_c0_seq1:125-952(-)
MAARFLFVRTRGLHWSSWRTAQSDAHATKILEQFTLQAAPFALAEPIRHAGVLKAIVDAASPLPTDTSLDIACGPGLLTCATAPRVATAWGVDFVPAMLQEAKGLQESLGLRNVHWLQGDAYKLPFADGLFDVVTSRLAFHHLQDPAAAVKEMKRVARPGGRLVVADIFSPPDERASTLHAMELRRDPSHVRFLRVDELESIFHSLGLATTKSWHSLEGDLDSLIARSFTDADSIAYVRAEFERAADTGSLGLPVWRRGREVRYVQPMVLLTACV